LTWIDNERLVFRELVGGEPDAFYAWGVDQDQPEPLPVDLGEYLDMTPASASPGGEWLAFGALHPVRGWDLVQVALREGPGLHDILVTEANEQLPEYSPDGSLIAYVSDFSGQNEVYVTRASEPGSRGISLGPGFAFRWSADGDVLYRFQPTESRNFANVVLASSIRQDLELEAVETVVAFDLGERFSSPRHFYWEIGADGRFLGWMDREPYVDPTRIRVVLNWFERLRRTAEER
jgi:hypothetical protein